MQTATTFQSAPEASLKPNDKAHLAKARYVNTPVADFCTPDLTAIGKLRPREDLLESILEPSRRIEPKYAAYVANLADGRSITGLLVKRDDKEVVLRDAQNKEITIKGKNLEELRPSRTSLMPEGQLAGLTAQEAADLLEYLATRR